MEIAVSICDALSKKLGIEISKTEGVIPFDSVDQLRVIPSLMVGSIVGANIAMLGGVAIPHAKSAWVKTPTVVVGKSTKGIEWESLDDEPVNMVFLIAVPEGEGNEHLKILQVLAVSLMDDDFKEELEKETDASAIEKLLLNRTK